MKRSFIGVILFFCPFIIKTCFSQIVIEGYAPTYKTSQVSLLKYSDYFSYKQEVIEQNTIDSNGIFNFQIKTDKAFLTIIQIENIYGTLYIDPSTKKYKVFFPEYEDNYHGIRNHSQKNIQLVFQDLSVDDLNTMILDFNLRLDFFLIGDTSKLIRMANHGKSFKDSLDVFKQKLIPLYKNVKKEFLHNYIRYSIALIEQLSDRSNHKKNSIYVYNSYLKEFPILYQNDAYMQFFNNFYENIISIPELSNEEKIQFAINNYGNLKKLDEAFANDYFFHDQQIRELAIIKGLGEIFYDIHYDQQNILSILEEIKLNSLYNDHKKIANNMIYTLTKLMPGFSAPDFKLINQKNKTISLSSNKGKYIYLGFFSTWNSRSLLEMQILKDLKKKYNNIIFISICLDKNKNDYLSFIRENPELDWAICHYNNNSKILSDYNINSIPIYYLINPDGTINQAPAYSPNSPNTDGTNQTIDKTFFYIKKNSEIKNDNKIGGKN